MTSLRWMRSLRFRGLLFFFACFLGLWSPSARADFGTPAPFAFRDRLFDVAFVTDSIAVIVGYPGKVFRSTDSGKTWELVPIDTTEPLFSVFFLNDKIGWIAGRKGLVFKTTDAGLTWTRQKTDTEEHLFDIDFVNENFGIAVGNFGAIITTADGGQTWTAHQLEAMSSASIYRVQMFDELNGFLAGEYPTWEAQLEEDVSASSLSSLFKTTDGGTTWERVEMPTTSHLFGMDFRSPTDGLVTGSKGLMLSTADGGATWTEIKTGSEFHLLDVDALPSGKVVACGNAGAAVYVDQGGAQVVPTHAYYWFAACAVNAQGNGIIVGDHGLVMLSGDDGKSWHKLEPASESKD